MNLAAVWLYRGENYKFIALHERYETARDAWTNLELTNDDNGKNTTGLLLTARRSPLDSKHSV
jgi:hypothetical protein